jgi:hypothetical protein
MMVVTMTMMMMMMMMLMVMRVRGVMLVMHLVRSMMAIGAQPMRVEAAAVVEAIGARACVDKRHR